PGQSNSTPPERKEEEETKDPAGAASTGRRPIRRRGEQRSVGNCPFDRSCSGRGGGPRVVVDARRARCSLGGLLGPEASVVSSETGARFTATSPSSLLIGVEDYVDNESRLIALDPPSQLTQFGHARVPPARELTKKAPRRLPADAHEQKAAKAKVVEDKTFGLKNKNKSTKVNKYIQQVRFRDPMSRIDAGERFDRSGGPSRPIEMLLPRRLRLVDRISVRAYVA
ncbi:MAG: hypothetical protein BJ554DRAFT_6595, partial [Olpidium bornovanus]